MKTRHTGSDRRLAHDSRGNDVDASKKDVGGYHLVWARDLYEVATAFLAMGDRGAAERALNYLFERTETGWGIFPAELLARRQTLLAFPADGRSFYPSILAWQLGKTDKNTFTNISNLPRTLLWRMARPLPRSDGRRRPGIHLPQLPPRLRD